ncbi:MAG: hypothetical protein AAF682_05970 [Planctomycetota bacterium]
MVAFELLRALGAAAVTPLRAGAYLMTRGRQVAELRADLDDPRPVDAAPELSPPRERPLRIFVSCAEPSGELHAVNLVHALRAELAEAGAPEPELVGLGGARLAAAGVQTVGDPVARAAMGAAATKELGFYLGLLTDVADELRQRPPDLVLPVDSPALHVPLGHIAQAYDAPVVHFVTPQYWGWAPWRIGGYRRAVDLALSILPFEPAWFARRGMRVAHVGHPLLDELQDAPAERAGKGSRVLALLPGSRKSVIAHNLPWMLTVAARVRLEVPDLEVVLPHNRADLADEIRSHLEAAQATSWVRLATGDLHHTLGEARAALSVSGTVLLDLLHHRLPAVVVYRLAGAVGTALAGKLLTAPYFSSVNLLAGREVLPEFCFHGDGPHEEVAGRVLRCLRDDAWRDACRVGLDEAAERLGPPGAVQRAARQALAVASGGNPR